VELLSGQTAFCGTAMLTVEPVPRQMEVMHAMEGGLQAEFQPVFRHR